MRSRSSAVDHDAAVTRRLELLTVELAAARERSEGVSDPWSLPAVRPLRAVPDRPEDPPDSDDPAPEPVVARMPGRHASRRTTRGRVAWGDLVPAPLRGRVWLGPGHVVAVAVVAVLGLVVTCWCLVRGGSHEVAAPVAVQTPVGALVEPAGSAGPPASGGPAPGGPASGGPASGVTGPGDSAPSQVVVDVTGKVRRPGIAVLDAGDRVVDAIRAAGGARRGVDLSGLNLARVLTDGEQIVVGGSTPAAPGVPGATAAPGTPALVNLNTADQTALESLPEVGPVTAQAIIAWRTEHGGFTAVSQLLDVDGIGDATLAQITPFVTV